MGIKSVKMKISTTKNLMSKGSLNPYIRFLGQKVTCRPFTYRQPHTHWETHIQSDYWGHPFRVQPIIKDWPNKHNAELNPSTKDKGAIFSKIMPKIDFYYSHHFNWEKTCPSRIAQRRRIKEQSEHHYFHCIEIFY